jgi:tripartite-type tricarboxylate transporter receptor subunit TctC
MRKVSIFAAALAALLAVGAGNALAQRAADFPTKQVRLVIPFPPGLGTETFARAFANSLSTSWKQPVVVEPRPGGNQVIAGEAVAKSSADGYSLLMATQGFAHEKLLNKDIPIDPAVDLTPIVHLAGSGIVYAVPAQLPVNNFAEFVAYAKANPGKVNHAQVAGSAANPETVGFWEGLGVQLVDVPYKGGTQAFLALMTGEVQLYAHSAGEVHTQWKAGKVKPIMYSDRTRHPLFPELPTLGEASGTNRFHRFVYVLFAPAAIPADLIAKINASANEALKSAEVRERASQQGLQIYGGSVEQSRQDVAAGIKRVQDVLATGVKLR